MFMAPRLINIKDRILDSNVPKNVGIAHYTGGDGIRDVYGRGLGSGYGDGFTNTGTGSGDGYCRENGSGIGFLEPSEYKKQNILRG